MKLSLMDKLNKISPEELAERKKKLLEEYQKISRKKDGVLMVKDLHDFRRVIETDYDITRWGGIKPGQFVFVAIKSPGFTLRPPSKVALCVGSGIENACRAYKVVWFLREGDSGIFSLDHRDYPDFFFLNNKEEIILC